MRALVVKLSALGDILHAMPAVRRLILAGISAGWLVDARYAGVLELFPGLDAVHVVDLKGWGRSARSGHVFSALSSLRGQLAGVRSPGYDVAFDVQGLLKSAVLARMAGTGRVVGYSRRACREKAAARFYTRRVDVDPLRPVTEQILTVFSRECGIPAEPAPPGLVVPRAARDRAQEILEGSAPAVLLAGAGWATKLIPVPVLVRVARHLARTGPVLVLSGNDQEESRARQVAAEAANTRVLHREDLPTVAGILERARVVVGPDTGLIHLAAGLDAPTVSLYGPSLAERSGPAGEGHAWLQADVPCTPCFQRECTDFICMDSLKPETVVAAVDEVMR